VTHFLAFTVSDAAQLQSAYTDHSSSLIIDDPLVRHGSGEHFGWFHTHRHPRSSLGLFVPVVGSSRQRPAAATPGSASLAVHSLDGRRRCQEPTTATLRPETFNTRQNVTWIKTYE